MKMKILLFMVGLALVLSVSGQNIFAADEKKEKATATEKAFMKKAADGGMTEVELGKLAGEKGESQDVKDFGNRMVTDHSKMNDNMKEVAGKLGVTLAEKPSAKNQARIDKMGSMSGAAFDKAYVNEMVKDHKKDVAEFETASKEVKNEDLKKAIDDSIPTIKEHLEMIKKFSQAKKD